MRANAFALASGRRESRNRSTGAFLERPHRNLLLPATSYRVYH